MNISKERREYLLNNLLLFMKNELEDCGATIATYKFIAKFPEMMHYLSNHEPELLPASEDTAKFIAKCPCKEEELDIVTKYAISHELLSRYGSNDYKLTYKGMYKAEEYEEYLEKCIGDNQIVLNDYVKSTDNQINEMIIKSRNLYLTKDLDGALEKIWDVFERIKTIYTNLDKKNSTIKLCNACSTSLDFDSISDEFIALTNFGNDYQIRHFETDKIAIKDDETKIYLYFRMLILVTFIIKQIS